MNAQEIVVNQAIATAWANVIMLLTAYSITYFWYWIVRKNTYNNGNDRANWDDGAAQGISWFSVFVLIVACFIISCFHIPETVTSFMNPQFGLIKR